MTAHQTRGIRRDSTPRSTAPGESAFVLRTAADDDVPELVDLVQAAYRSEGGWTTEAHLVDGHRTDADEIRAMLADPQVTLLVAELDGDLAGCCYTHREPADEAGPSRAELGLFAVHPAMQSRGLGGRLLEAQAELLVEGRHGGAGDPGAAGQAGAAGLVPAPGLRRRRPGGALRGKSGLAQGRRSRHGRHGAPAALTGTNSSPTDDIES